MRTMLFLAAAAFLQGTAWADAPPMPGPVPQPKQIVPRIQPLSPQMTPVDPIQKDFKPAPLPPVKPEKKLPKAAVLPAQEQDAPSAAEALRGMDGGPAAKLGAWFDGGAR